jgi:hypothetical protein
MKKHIPFIEPRFWHALFLYCPSSNLDGCNDGFGERLSVLFLHQGLDTFTIYL